MYKLAILKKPTEQLTNEALRSGKKGRVGPQANKPHFFLFFRVGGPQAHKQKIVDNGPGMGYSTSITDGNARLAQLNASPSRIPGSSGRKPLPQTSGSLPQEQLGRRYLPGIFFT